MVVKRDRNARSVLVADPHPVLRSALVQLVDSEPLLRVVGAAADALSTVRHVRDAQPDVVVVNLLLAGLGTDSVIGTLRAVAPRAAILISGTGGDAEPYEAAARAAGATGYLSTDAAAEDLIAAILGAADGSGEAGAASARV